MIFYVSKEEKQVTTEKHEEKLKENDGIMSLIWRNMNSTSMNNPEISSESELNEILTTTQVRIIKILLGVIKITLN